MPEYLSPGVYVEEVDGAQSIEGVSTSTAGIVGVTERGPVDVTMLVTSFAEFRRTFGGYLEPARFPDLWYLPHAVEGFFQNGGKRIFVSRVTADAAAAATGRLYGAAAGAAAVSTALAATGRPGDVVLVLDDPTGLANGDTIRVDTGGSSEYLRLASTNALLGGLPNNARIRGLRVPLYRDCGKEDAVGVTMTEPATTVHLKIEGAVAPGSKSLKLDDVANVGQGTILRLGAASEPEFVVVASKSPDPADRSVVLTYPVRRSYPDDANAWVFSDAAVNSTKLSQSAAAGDGLIVVDDATQLANADAVRIGTGMTRIYHRIVQPRAVRLRAPLARAHPALEPVQVITDDIAQGNPVYASKIKPATGAPAGTKTIEVDADPSTTATAGKLVRVGAGAKAEFRVVEASDAATKTITFTRPLDDDHPVDDPVVLESQGTAAPLVQPVLAGGRILLLAIGAAPATGALLQIGDAASASAEYLAADPAAVGGVVVADPPDSTHAVGTAVATRTGMLTVRALDVGEWGNGLRVVAERDGPVLDTRVGQPPAAPGLPIPLESVSGLEPGTILEVGYQPGSAVTGTLAKVNAIKGRAVELVPAVPVTAGMPVRTREFKLTVEWIKDDRVVQSETFERLSLDARHSRYAPSVLGAIGGPVRISDRRPEGDSELVRVTDDGAATSDTTIRIWPDLLTAPTATGALRPFGHLLNGGSDSVATIDKSGTFIGADDVEPAKRRGLHVLRNEPRISIVAIPGRTELDVQQELIIQCELMRYRFAVLDSLSGPPRAGASLQDVQRQRQRYDTRYAALYYPWLTIPDPGPSVPDLVVPPSGHVLGIYADTDVVRGVHKAPANAVVRGITGFQRKVSKAEQDLLNPSPTNVNVLRDFREDSRGLRVWGARVTTSNTDWKYVNVRRLFIFLEASLDIGLQWVVFEPNDTHLWARVRQTATEFLTRVWRDGALMGTKPEEAFFVRCDETTMTLDDLKLGKLIVVIGVAPVRPAEFVIVRIGQWAGGSEVQEL